MIDRERDHILGTGPLELLVYGDYQCPYTRNALESIAHLRDRLGERLTFAFRHFPLRHKHARAQAAAEAVEAADAQGRFWAMHEALLRHPGKLSDEELRRWAVEALLDLPRFEADLRESVGYKRIREDIESARGLRLTGTPRFFIGGEPYHGFYDAESLYEELTSRS